MWLQCGYSVVTVWTSCILEKDCSIFIVCAWLKYCSYEVGQIVLGLVELLLYNILFIAALSYWIAITDARYRLSTLYLGMFWSDGHSEGL